MLPVRQVVNGQNAADHPAQRRLPSRVDGIMIHDDSVPVSVRQHGDRVARIGRLASTEPGSMRRIAPGRVERPLKPDIFVSRRPHGGAEMCWHRTTCPAPIAKDASAAIATCNGLISSAA